VLTIEHSLLFKQFWWKNYHCFKLTVVVCVRWRC